MPKKTCTSRERVILALEHQEPDRVPFDLALTVDTYHRLRAYLGLPPDTAAPVGFWTEVPLKLDLVEAMQLDIVPIGLNRPSRWNPPKTEDGIIYDEWGIGRKKVERPDGSYYFEMAYHPLANASLKDVENYTWPDPFDPGRVDGLREKFLVVRRETDKACMAKFSNSIWEQAWWLVGTSKWLELLVDNPEIASAILDKTCEIAIGRMAVGFDAAGDLVDIVRLSGEDLGTQKAPIISPGMFKRIVQPRFQRLWSFAIQKIAEKNPRAKLMLHSCGSVRPFIPTWIEMGLDILDPIQPRAEGMDPAGLKRDFGDRLSFHGGIDLQYTLPFGSPSEVMAEVRSCMIALGQGGGYIVSPAHNVQSDVPPTNLVAIRDAIEAYGHYPLPAN